VAALAEDDVFGVAEGLDVFGLEGEVAGDPFLVEGAEGGDVLGGLQGVDLDLHRGLAGGVRLGVGGLKHWHGNLSF